MADATWSIAVGILVFIIALVISIILYVKFKQWSVVVYVASLATYTFAFFYTWDVFQLSKNVVLILLIISTIIMMGIGKYFSTVTYKIKGDKHHGK
jgi:hypothetical protein